ncbi:hypothetical protein REPUB_Repub19eG0054000 [Reevesia pubescens]
MPKGVTLLSGDCFTVAPANYVYDITVLVLVAASELDGGLEVVAVGLALALDGALGLLMEFKDIGHSKTAQNLVLKYQVGVLHGYTFKKDEDVQAASIEEPKKKEMSTFVIKDDCMPKYAALAEFFVPLLVAGSYFSYRYLTTGSYMV